MPMPSYFLPHDTEIIVLVMYRAKRGVNGMRGGRLGCLIAVRVGNLIGQGGIIEELIVWLAGWQISRLVEALSGVRRCRFVIRGIVSYI